jgi:hypothetical protein
VKRLIAISLLVLVAATTYRSFGSAETGTGTLTLAPPAPNVGQDAPEFTAKTAEGDTFALSDEGVYVLAFWSTLNEGSNEARPGFAQLAQEYGDEVSFAVVYVNSVPRYKDTPYARLQDATGKLTSLYNVKQVPRLFLVEDGTVNLVHDFYYEGYEKDLEEALEDALEGKSASG